MSKSYQFHGGMLLDAFRLHDQDGVPLEITMEVARTQGVGVNLAAFACDALFAGWHDDKVRRVIEHACADNGVPFAWAEFKLKLAQLWTVTGKHPDPAMWTKMKEHLADA